MPDWKNHFGYKINVALHNMFAYNLIFNVNVAIYYRVYLTGLPVQLSFSGEPERVCCKTVQVFTFVQAIEKL